MTRKAGNMAPDTLLDAIASFAEEREATIAIVFNATRSGRWAAHLTFGREAPDSPMAAGQALGMGESLSEVLEQLVHEAQIEVPEPDPDRITITFSRDVAEVCFAEPNNVQAREDFAREIAESIQAELGEGRF